MSEEKPFLKWYRQFDNRVAKLLGDKKKKCSARMVVLPDQDYFYAFNDDYTRGHRYILLGVSDLKGGFKLYNDEFVIYSWMPTLEEQYSERGKISNLIPFAGDVSIERNDQIAEELTSLRTGAIQETDSYKDFTALEYTCIQLKLPFTGVKWLDDLIKKSHHIK